MKARSTNMRKLKLFTSIKLTISYKDYHLQKISVKHFYMYIVHISCTVFFLFLQSGITIIFVSLIVLIKQNSLGSK